MLYEKKKKKKEKKKKKKKKLRDWTRRRMDGSISRG